MGRYEKGNKLLKILFLYVLILRVSSQTSRTQIYNAAFQKPVTIEPNDGSCGSVGARSQINRPYVFLEPDNPEQDFNQNDQLVYEQATCATDCGRKYPQSHTEELQLQEPDNGIILGDPSCKPIKTLEIKTEESEPRRRKRELPSDREKRNTINNDECQKTFTNTGSTTQTYSFWVKPDTENNYSNISVVLHVENLFFVIYERMTQMIKLTTVDADNPALNGASIYIGPYRTHIGIQFNGNLPYAALYVNGSDVLSRLGLFLQNNTPGETISLGSPIVNPTTECEPLEISQCRDLHFAYSVESGSQDDEFLPFFPNFTSCPLVTDERATLIYQFFCAAYFRACTLTGEKLLPCQSFCTSILTPLQDECRDVTIQHAGILNCGLYPDDDPCIRPSSFESFDYGSFRGEIWDFEVYNEILTVRELLEIATGQEVDLNPHSECMCTTDYPVNNITGFNCYDIIGEIFKPRLHVALPTDNFYFSKEFITDGQVIPSYGEHGTARLEDSLYWVSTPEIDTVSVIIDLQKVIQVARVEITMFFPFPERAIAIYRRINGEWKPWHYFSPNCDAIELPESGRLDIDTVSCQPLFNRGPEFEEYEFEFENPPTLNSKNPTLIFNVLRDRPGTNDGWIDERLVQFMLAEEVKVEFQGQPVGRSNEPEYKYHAVEEIAVYGRDYEEPESCDLICFRGTEKNPPDPDFEEPILASGDDCTCECREPFQRDKAGAQCTPYIEHIYPTFGPEAGGTTIYMRGGLLSDANNNATSRIVLFPEENYGPPESCTVLFWNDTHIACNTTIQPQRPWAVNRSHEVRVYHPEFQGYYTVAPEPFTFKPNPDILSVYPRNSIVEGGVLLTVEGTNLESVAVPRMRVKITYKGNTTDWTPFTICTVRNNTVMVCPTPKLVSYLPQEYLDRLNENRTEIIETRRKRSTREDGTSLLSLLHDYIDYLASGHRSKRQASAEGITINDENLEFTLGFALDGVPKYQDLEEDLPSQSSLDVYVNPDIASFSPLVQDISSKWPQGSDGEVISIGGKNLDKGARMDDYRIFVGHETCEVTDLLSELLSCVAPGEEPDNSRLSTKDGGVVVRLFVGNVNRVVGYLKYQAWWETGAFIGIMVALALLVLIIGAVIAYCFYRRRTDPHYLDLKRRATSNPYQEVPQKDKHILEKIDPSLRQQIRETLLEDPDNLEVGEEVGKGNFGKVYSGTMINPVTREKTHVAVKTVRGDTNINSIEEFLKEAIVMKFFKHPNVLPLLGVVIKENVPYVILPFMDNGDLKTFVSNEKNRFTVRELVTFGLDVAKGMAYLEQQRFVHRDLAARNCMVDKDKRIVIADFGLARDIYVSDYYRVEDRSRPLPIRWMAIESIEQQKFTTKSDVWSFGVVLWELLSRGLKPYPGIDNLDIKRFLKRGERLEKPSHAPPEVYDVIKQCWHTQPEDRPTFQELANMLENLLQGRKPDAKPRASDIPQAPDTPTTPTSPNSEYTKMEPRTPPNATYLELVDMPSGDSAVEGYLPMK